MRRSKPQTRPNSAHSSHRVFNVDAMVMVMAMAMAMAMAMGMAMLQLPQRCSGIG